MLVYGLESIGKRNERIIVGVKTYYPSQGRFDLNIIPQNF